MFELNPLLIKALAGIALVVLVIVAYNKWSGHYFDAGVKEESDRRDKIDLQKEMAANAALRVENAKTRAAERKLSEALATISNQQTELQHVKTDNQLMQSSLIARDKRLSVLLARPDNSAGQDHSPAVAIVDQGTQATAELDGTVAANLVALVGAGDEAIVRLNACVDAYDSVATAINTDK